MLLKKPEHLLAVGIETSYSKRILIADCGSESDTKLLRIKN
jgi:hypothetical protein